MDRFHRGQHHCRALLANFRVCADFRVMVLSHGDVSQRRQDLPNARKSCIDVPFDLDVLLVHLHFLPRRGRHHSTCRNSCPDCTAPFLPLPYLLRVSALPS